MAMDFEKILGKCGDCHRYQYMLLALYGLLMFIVSRHYFAQSVISFVPDHWCYHEQLENRSYAEIAAIYAPFESPSCTQLASIDWQEYNATVSGEPCTRWIYNYDHGFRSMNADVREVSLEESLCSKVAYFSISSAELGLRCRLQGSCRSVPVLPGLHVWHSAVWFTRRPDWTHSGHGPG